MRNLLFFAILFLSVSVQAQKLVKTKLAANISLKVPDNFTPMTDEDKLQRYESSRLPIALYTDPDRLAELGINRAYSIWQEGDIAMMQKFYEASITELYDKVEFLKKEIANVNGHEFVIFEFESVVYPENKFQRNITKYTYLMYALNDGTTYLFNFTCEKAIKSQWLNTAHKIMASVKLK
jgi:hypothetical protein